jgi:hypothetical protein
VSVPKIPSVGCDLHVLGYDDAHARHSERFVRKHPEPPELPTTVWINRPENDTDTNHSTNP